MAEKLATPADLTAYLDRIRANAEKVMRNSASGRDAAEQARNWYDLACWMLDQGDDHPDEGLADKLRHWRRLLERIDDEVRAGLHIGEAQA